MNPILVSIARRAHEGLSIGEIATSVGFPPEWIKKVMSTDGYLVVAEAVEKGNV